MINGLVVKTGSQVKSPPAHARDARDAGLNGLGRSPGGGHGNLVQYSGLENLMDRESWQAIALGVERVGFD